MVFCSDEDVRLVQPYVFEHGVESFSGVYGIAGDEVVRDVEVAWLCGRLSSGVVGYGVVFDGELLEPLEWVRVAVFRSLGWHVLPLLAGSVGGEGMVAMMRHYRAEYERKLQRHFSVGFLYGGSRVFVSVVSELQRVRR